MALTLPMVLFIKILHLNGALLTSGLPTWLGRFGREGIKRVAALAVKVYQLLFSKHSVPVGLFVFAATLGYSLAQLQGSDSYLSSLQNNFSLFINQGLNQFTWSKWTLSPRFLSSMEVFQSLTYGNMQIHSS